MDKGKLAITVCTNCWWWLNPESKNQWWLTREAIIITCISRKQRIQTTKHRATTTVAILSNCFRNVFHYQSVKFSFCFFTGLSPPPANVSGYSISSTSIFVQWDQVPAAHQNGAILYYTVTYRALPSGSLQTSRVSAPTNQITLTGLNGYTKYSITVFASTCKAGNVSAPIFVFTNEGSKWQYLWPC